MLTLQDLINIEKIKEKYPDIKRVQYWWYGKDIESLYIGNGELLIPPGQIKGADYNALYLVGSGIDGHRSIYRFAIRLTGFNDETKHFDYIRVPLELDDYSNRLVLYKKTRFTFYCGQLNLFEVENIYAPESERTVAPFKDYESVELSFPELKEVIDNKYSDYYKPLSTVKGVYMIIDGNTGKQYIGSAYGDEAIYSRWANYALTYHGGNMELIKLYEEYGKEYFDQFKYFILRIMPKKTPVDDVIAAENYYKERYLTRKFGLNAN